MIIIKPSKQRNLSSGEYNHDQAKNDWDNSNNAGTSLREEKMIRKNIHQHKHYSFVPLKNSDDFEARHRERTGGYVEIETLWEERGHRDVESLIPTATITAMDPCFLQTLADVAFLLLSLVQVMCWHLSVAFSPICFVHQLHHPRSSTDDRFAISPLLYLIKLSQLTICPSVVQKAGNFTYSTV